MVRMAGCLISAFIFILCLSAAPAAAQTQTAPADSLKRIELKDGSTLQGRIIEQTDTQVVVRTLNDLEVKVPRANIRAIEPLQGRMVGGEFRRYDPNYTRLLFSPTGRPLRQGDGYFSDYYIFFPGVAYGVTNNISVMAGFSFLPGMGLTDQLFYVAPRFGARVNEQLSLSAGTIYFSLMGEGGAGLAFLVGSYGPPEKSLTVGLAYPYVNDTGDDFDFSSHPILMLGGNWRLSNNLALLSENWIFTGPEVSLSQVPFTVALRFFGERLSVDLGFVIVGEVIKEGFPIPWLSAAYNFGR